MKQTRLWVALCHAVLASACGAPHTTLPDGPPAPPATPKTVQVYTYTGSTQCADTGTAAPELALRLVEAGVSVSDALCGNDGMMRVAQCGAPDGAIAVFAIALDDLGAAKEAGFEPLSDLAAAKLMPCNQ